MDPAAAGQPDPVELTAHDLLEREDRMPGTAPGRKASHVADPIAQHRHAVAVELRDEDRGGGLARLRLDEHVGPIDFELEAPARVRLEGDQADVAAAVALVYGPAEHRLDQLAHRRGELLGAGHEAPRWIARAPAARADLGRQRPERVRVGEQVARAPPLEGRVILGQRRGREPEALERVRVVDEGAHALAEAVAGLGIEVVAPEARRARAGGQTDPPHVVLDPALAPAPLARPEPHQGGNARGAAGRVRLELLGAQGDRHQGRTGPMHVRALERRERREVVEREIAARVESDLVAQPFVVGRRPARAANRLAKPREHPLAALVQGPAGSPLAEAQSLAGGERRLAEGRPREPVEPARRLQQAHRDQVVRRRNHAGSPSPACSSAAAPASPWAIARAATARPAK